MNNSCTFIDMYECMYECVLISFHLHKIMNGRHETISNYSYSRLLYYNYKSVCIL